MQIVSNDYKEMLNTNLSLSPKSKIVVDGVEYLGDVIKTSPKISHSNISFIGGFPAKKVSFDIFNLDNNLNFENKEITVFRGLEVNGSIEWVKQGVFIPQAKDMINDITTRTLKISNAQDRTQLFDGLYKSSLDWTDGQTHTGLEIVQEICTKLNITLETTDFAWSNYSFKQPNFNETTTDREVISRLAEIGGEIALITSNGGLAIKGQYTTGDTIQRHRYEKLSKEKPFIANTVVLGKDGIEDDIVYPESISEDRIEFKILDNPFVDLYREEMIEQVASYIVGKSYIPFNLQGFVDGFIYELNDVVSVVDKNGETFNAVILDYSTSSRIKSIVKADAKGKITTNFNLAGSKANSINQVKLEVDHINNTINALSKSIEDLTDYLRTANGTSSLTLNETVESNGAIGKLVMTGFTEMPLYPNMAYPSKKTYAGKLTSYTIVQTNGTDTHETYIDLGMPLSGTDELIIENSKVYVKRNNKVTDMNLPVILKTFTGTTTISVKFFNNIKFTCEYLIENDFTKVFALQAEISAQINITNDLINSKVTKAEVVSEINQSAEQVKIDASKINLNGYISNDEGSFEITEDGRAKFKDVTITGGDINLPSGGKVIGGQGILTNLTYNSIGRYQSFDMLGFMILASMNGGYNYGCADISLDFTIPDNFTIVNAYVTLHHTPALWNVYNESTNEMVDVWGYARNLKLYSVYQNSNYEFHMTYGGEYEYGDSSLLLTEITNAFGSSSYQPSNQSGSSIVTKQSVDIQKSISKGHNKLIIRTSDAIPSDQNTSCSKTGMARAEITVIGYMSI